MCASNQNSFNRGFFYRPKDRITCYKREKDVDFNQNFANNRKKRRKICCVNCGREGHLYRDCSNPVTSFGIIAFRRRTPQTQVGPVRQYNIYLCDKHSECSPPDVVPSDDTSSEMLYLMVQRKDTMGFIDFVRGKYADSGPERDKMLNTYLGEMTCEERKKLLTWSFDDIWNALWLNHTSKCYVNEYYQAAAKFSKLNIPALLTRTDCQWSEQEYGFPKGRKTMYESNYHCAVREFCEESGYYKHELRVLTKEPIEEVFVGTDGKPYRHVYYVAEIPSYVGPPRLDMDNIQQVGEIRNISWFTYEQCMKIIRPYDVAKREILRKVHQQFSKSNTKIN